MSSDMLELEIERPAQGGRMIARHDGAIVLVAGGIPGERVRARVTERRRGVTFADTVDVLTASPDRREPPFDPLCGGNLLAHIAYPRQLALKQEMLADAFRRQARLTLDALPPITPSPEAGYRMRARLHLADGRIGFYRERSRDVCDAGRTGQLSEETATTLYAAAEALAPVAADVVELVLAENAPATERLLEPVMLPGMPGERTAAVRARLAGVRGLSDGPVITDTLPGGGSLERHAASFFQANRFLLDLLVTRVTDAAGSGNLADLFAGVGLFAVEAASRGAEVIAIEQDAISSRDLVRNLAPFGLSARAVSQSVEGWLEDRGSIPETVIVDPPRTGLSPAARGRLIALKPETIVYVSCDPVTLARDVKDCVAGGFRLTQIEALDMFPNTPHVESIAVLRR